MSNNPSIPSVKILSASELPDLKKTVAHLVWEKKTSMTELSRKLGQKQNFVHYHLSNRDLRVSHLIALSEQLKTNFFQAYVDKLSEPLRPLAGEKLLLTTIEAQNTKINELEKELAQVKAERDKYWDAVAGKAGR